MTSSCPGSDPLAPAPQAPASPERQPGVSVYTSDEGTEIQIDGGITAGELGLKLALLVPSAARLADGDLVLRFTAPARLP